MITALTFAGVNTLVDVRHLPCSSQLDPEHRYGPKDWNLQVSEKGITHNLKFTGIKYLWVVELGNPQKNDRDMKIMREHIASQDDRWPINRGLKILYDIVTEQDRQCCLLCACKEYEACHRKVVAEALRGRYFKGELEIRDLKAKKE
jgi:uncharacterized protein (DUF488 family)